MGGNQSGKKQELYIKVVGCNVIFDNYIETIQLKNVCIFFCKREDAFKDYEIRVSFCYRIVLIVNMCLYVLKKNKINE